MLATNQRTFDSDQDITVLLIVAVQHTNMKTKQTEKSKHITLKMANMFSLTTTTQTDILSNQCNAVRLAALASFTFQIQ